VPKPRSRPEDRDRPLEPGAAPDALIDRAALENRAAEARNPVVVFEFLSDGGKARDFMDKLAEYDAWPAIVQYVLVCQDRARVVV
jgi:Uma2 family endonuclease